MLFSALRFLPMRLRVVPAARTAPATTAVHASQAAGRTYDAVSSTVTNSATGRFPQDVYRLPAVAYPASARLSARRGGDTAPASGDPPQNRQRIDRVAIRHRHGPGRPHRI